MDRYYSSRLHEPFPGKLTDLLAVTERRILLFGPPGTGKSTLANGLGAALQADGRQPWCLAADPGSPSFGVPGAVSLGKWNGDAWALEGLEALCSLDAARFRLPLVLAIGNLVDRLPPEAVLIVDAPGVVRGVAGAELLTSLADTVDFDRVFVLVREGREPMLRHELGTLDAPVTCLRAADDAHRPGKRHRERRRTRLWDAYLEGGRGFRCEFDTLRLLGTPPRQAAEAWAGKQVAFLEAGRTLCLGEVTAADGEGVEIRLPPAARPGGVLLVRDACRSEEGLLSSGKRFGEGVVRYLPPADLLPDALAGSGGGVRPMTHTGTAVAALMNGVFGDPLLHLRLRHKRRSLLFDLGDGSRLPARIAHQVSDVFISHAHVDHIGGFLWLLRSRIGEESVCRLYGPPGMARHIQGLIDGVHWDRIGSRGPVFEVVELHGDVLETMRLKAGVPGCETLERRVAAGGIVLAESGFRVRAVTLDHGIPVLAYAYEPSRQINVRKDRLRERRVAPGPWLDRLKRCILEGDLGASIEMPDGVRESVSVLAEELTLESAGARLAYATDFADTPENRRRLVALAGGAHTLFCEASFLDRDAEQARRTGHLTTSACGEIARESRVQHLIPFHFSRRYEKEPWRVYREIAAVCPSVVIPSEAVGTA